MSETQSTKQLRDAMQDDEEEEDEDNLPHEDGNNDAKQKKKPRKKKKKKGKPQDGDEPLEGSPRPEDGLLYWPAPEAAPVGHGPPGKDEEWVDITALCDLAVNGMSVGEMVESSTFRLYDAMSAIEIMDPKMDTGFRSNEDMSLEKAEASGLIGKPLDDEVVAGVMDHLLMYFLLWLDGHTIIQTCFSLLYLQDPKRLLSPVPELASFVDAFLVACRCAYDAITAAGVADDEDFVPAMFGVDLQAFVFNSEPQKVSERLRNDCDRLRAAKRDVLACRLEFMGKYMSALVDLTERPSKTKAVAVNLAKCSQLLERMEATAAPPSETVLQRFDASTNRKLLVPGPPRTVEPIKDPKVAFKMWTCHVQDLSMCTSLLDRSLNQLLNGTIAHRVSKELPNVLVRSLAQLSVATPGFVRRLLLESLEVHLFPAEALQHCKRLAEPFLVRCESMFLHLMKLAHLNGTRRFRRLAHVFPDFNELQHEAWRLDEALKATFAANLRYHRPCWAWIQDFALQAMVSKLLLGFHLELYDQAELHMIYWYVDYLLGLRIYNLNEVFCSKEMTAGGGKKKSNARPKEGALGKQKPRSPPTALLLLEATQNLVRGLFRALAFCSQELMSSPPAVETGLCQRFVLRFRSLEHFRLPHLPSFEDFKQSAVLAQESAEKRSVLSASQSSFMEAAQLLERLQPSLKEEGGENAASAQSLRRVVVANQLAVTQLLRCLDSGAEELARKRVSAELVHHSQFVSIQVVDKGK